MAAALKGFECVEAWLKLKREGSLISSEAESGEVEDVDEIERLGDEGAEDGSQAPEGRGVVALKGGRWLRMTFWVVVWRVVVC